MNYFLDCGYYVGKAVEYYAPFLDDWTIIAFEPNEELNVAETSQKFKNFYWVQAAVWIADEDVDFVLSEKNDSSFIKGLSNNAPKRTIRVPAIDFSKYVSELPKEATIVCSMDIEGAEYPVLEKLLADDTMKRISLLDIEFHHRLLPDKDAQDTEDLIRRIQGAGTLVKVKVPLQ